MYLVTLKKRLQCLYNYACLLMGTSLLQLFLHLLISIECQLCLNNFSYKLKRWKQRRFNYHWCHRIWDTANHACLSFCIIPKLTAVHQFKMNLLTYPQVLGALIAWETVRIYHLNSLFLTFRDAVIFKVVKRTIISVK